MLGGFAFLTWNLQVGGLITMGWIEGLIARFAIGSQRAVQQAPIRFPVPGTCSSGCKAKVV